jgi:uncharacterized membrane protein
MRVQTRRMIGLASILIFLIVYVAITAQIGAFFVDKHIIVNIGFFVIAGIVWVFPLKPLFNWMRAKPHEIPDGEKPPKVSNLKSRRK